MIDETDRNPINNPAMADLITLGEAALISGLSPNHLRLLVSKKIMWGRKLGRNWFTTEKAVQDYLKLGIRPGPKPKKPGK
jgi:hypothetical protein